MATGDNYWSLSDWLRDTEETFHTRTILLFRGGSGWETPSLERAISSWHAEIDAVLKELANDADGNGPWYPAGGCMNALFYFTAYDRGQNCYARFLVTVRDGPHDRYAAAKDELAKVHDTLAHWSGMFVCLTNEDVFKEV